MNLLHIHRVILVLIFAGALAATAEMERPSFPEDRREGDVFLDIGDHASKPNLGFGWGRAERGASLHFRWIWRMEADLFFEVTSPRDAEFWLTAAPLYLPYRRQVIAVYVNDALLTEWLCPDHPDFTDYRAEIPADMLRAGRNMVTLRMGYRKRGNDDRELSLAVDRALLCFP